MGLLVLGLYLGGLNTIALIFGSGLFAMAVRNGWRRWRGGTPVLAIVPIVALPAGGVAASFSLGSFFLTCLKIGSVVFGSGYVLLAFLRADFVLRLGWLTDHQILDAVAVGQFTPGPVFTTATFIGYLLGGVSGGLLGTLGIFLPSFIIAAAVFPLVGTLRRSLWASAFLDGVNVGALGLMAGVTWQLGRAAFVDWPTLALTAVSALVLFRFRINSAWIILGGGIVGLVLKLITASS
jgi:chromate transporter